MINYYLPIMFIICAKDEITLAEALRAEGYKTFFAGKWHLGDEDHTPKTMDLKSIKVVGIKVAHWGAIFHL